MVKEKRNSRMPIAIAAAVVMVVVVIAAGVVTGMLLKGESRSFAKSDEIFGNPLMGYAPCAWEESVSEDVNLLYVDITWRELEPEEGVYDWTSIEEENQLERWRKEGKHIVLRFVCDIPGKESHMDIPDWLYEKTGEAGTWYDMEYGRGFAPDYGNETFIQYHEKAVAAMGEHLGTDGFVSYVELGSLGHWGEWHVNYATGIQRLPLEDVREQYVMPWLEAFSNAKLLMRRPFTQAREYGLGVYNDMTGHPNDTAEWLAWMEEGGEYDQTGETDAIVPMSDFWKTAPVGGEFTSSLSMEEMLDSNLQETLELLEQSHVTFLGPKIAEAEYEEGYQAVLGSMGYRIRISEAKLNRTFRGTSLRLTWENDGAAPMYEDWPVYVYVEDENGQITETASVDLKLSELLPGEQIQTMVRLNARGLLDRDRNGQRISVGIVDPMTGENAVRLSMEAGQTEGKTVLFE